MPCVSPRVIINSDPTASQFGFKKKDMATQRKCVLVIDIFPERSLAKSRFSINIFEQINS